MYLYGKNKYSVEVYQCNCSNELDLEDTSTTTAVGFHSVRRSIPDPEIVHTPMFTSFILK